MTARKILFLILDGISDRPCAILEGKTPLQYAPTPVLDALAGTGVCGIMDPIAPGVRPGSDTSHLALLGYNPKEYYTGRGPLEAVGCGIRMEKGMIGFRANFATIDSDGIVTDRRAGRVRNTAALCDAVQEGVDLSSLGIRFEFRPGAGHRAALALRGERLGAEVSSNDPKKEGVRMPPVRPLVKDGKAERTAEAANMFIEQSLPILADHPVNRERERQDLPKANCILLRGSGEMGHFPPFTDRYGLTGSVISAATLITGIGTAVGLEHVPVTGATGSATSNIGGKIAAAIQELEHRDFVLVNIKGADEAGHDGDARGKAAFIERIDRTIEPLLQLEETLIAVCADHSTPCDVRDHSADPVPLLIHGDGVRVDQVQQFDEIHCAAGGLHRITGPSLLPILLDLINKAHKYGA
jgi:2,3-bisphosphoglycerate-independent phosphoglycerate mutase